MPETKFDGWLGKSNSFVISNTGSADAYEVTPRSFIEPPIKMTIPVEFDNNDGMLKKWFTTEEADSAEGLVDDPPEFLENVPAIIRAESPDWRMTAADINTVGITLCYATNNQNIAARYNREYSTGMVVIVLFGPIDLKFERSFSDRKLMPIQYNVYAYVNYLERIMTAKICKAIGGHKVYELEMCEDNHGMRKFGSERSLWPEQYYTGKFHL